MATHHLFNSAGVHVGYGCQCTQLQHKNGEWLLCRAEPPLQVVDAKSMQCLIDNSMMWMTNVPVCCLVSAWNDKTHRMELQMPEPAPMDRRFMLRISASVGSAPEVCMTKCVPSIQGFRNADIVQLVHAALTSVGYIVQMDDLLLNGTEAVYENFKKSTLTITNYKIERLEGAVADVKIMATMNFAAKHTCRRLRCSRPGCPNRATRLALPCNHFSTCMSCPVEPRCTWCGMQIVMSSNMHDFTSHFLATIPAHSHACKK